MRTTAIVLAALLLATGTAHADALPKEMLGEWCRIPNHPDRDIYEHHNSKCESVKLNLKQNKYEGIYGERFGCDFEKITRLSNGSYFIRAECGGEGGMGKEDMIFQIEEGRLVIITTTIRFCVSVIKPPPNVVQNPEFDPKSWLGLREKPDMRSRITFRLGDNEYLEADAIKGDWTHISNVTRLSSTDNEGAKIVQGWVRSKYVKRFTCEHEKDCCY